MSHRLAAVAEGARELLGSTTFDVYLNDVAYWRNVPTGVWRYTIGGCQLIKKWLSYRERALLGRDLKPEEARYATEMVPRIAAIVLMGPELDANYERVKAGCVRVAECQTAVRTEPEGHQTTLCARPPTRAAALEPG